MIFLRFHLKRKERKREEREGKKREREKREGEKRGREKRRRERTRRKRKWYNIVHKNSNIIIKCNLYLFNNTSRE